MRRYDCWNCITQLRSYCHAFNILSSRYSNHHEPKIYTAQSNTLAKLADELAAGAALSIALGNFLDVFYRRPDTELLMDEPPLLAGTTAQAINAYLAGVAEHLSREYKLPVPEA